MTPAIYDLECPQGTTFTRLLTIKNDGVPMNLSGYTARMQVRLNYDSNDTIVSLTPGSGITLSASAGQITLGISASATAAFSPKSYVYDLEIESGGGDVSRLMQGTFVVSPEVTR